MPKLTINTVEVDVPEGTTVLQACQEAGVEVPVFCYHDRLKIAGNCRMCLVEVEKAPKPIASCAYPVAEGMVVKTNSPLAEKARKGTMEFLLINHPLDCPICDQGGECDLQDEAMVYGSDRTRYTDNKRSVQDKDMGPLIKTQMTRCIHCTRCIRFSTDVAGVEEMGAIGRGEHMEITSYLDKALTSELSGNVIDLCPVGALTSKPYAFKARSWELTKTESVDVMDAVGTNIRVDSRGSEVMRILPRIHEDVNEEWLSDKARFAYDGLKYQRLDQPYLRKEGKLVPVSWDEALTAVGDRLKGADSKKTAAIAGDQADAESMLALKMMMQKLGVENLDCRQDGMKLGPETGDRSHYLFNSHIAGIDEADACLIIGSNVRWEAPIINARLRKRWLQGGLPVAYVGPKVDLTYKADYLGVGMDVLQSLLSGEHAFSKILKQAKKPMIIVGGSVFTRDDAHAMLAWMTSMAQAYGMVSEEWNGLNVLHQSASRVAGLDLGFVPSGAGLGTSEIIKACGERQMDVLYLLGADALEMQKLGDTFVIYQGHHGDAGAHRADVILSGAAYTEKEATYTNTEGRVQQTRLAVFPPGEAKEDWKIIRALSEKAGCTLPFNELSDVRKAMVEMNPVFSETDSVKSCAWQPFESTEKLSLMPLSYPIENFYQTDPISRASKNMAKCTREILQGITETDSEAQQMGAAHG